MLKTLKAIIKVLATVLAGLLIVGAAGLLWSTRLAAVPGLYHADGVWGESTLMVRRDHTFTQSVKFMDYNEPITSPYPRHITFEKTINGRWENYGRSIFDQNIGFKPFISLVKSDHGKTFELFPTSYGPVGLALGIEIDTGRDITYWK